MDASPDAFEGLQELPQPARPSLEAGCFPLAAGGSPEVPEGVRLSLPADAHTGDDADAAAASAAAAKKKRRGKPRSAAAAEQPARQATRFTRQILQPAVPPRPVRRFGDETCIDPTHSLLCTSCTAAPELDEEHAYMLLGADGKKNGEKRLRSLLVRTAEWKDEKQRDAVIQACTSDPRLEALARVFQGVANCSELRKAHVLYLARAWRYKSDLWVKRTKRGDGGSDGSESGERGGSRKRPRASAALPLTDLAEEAEDAADAAAGLPLDWARVSPPSPPELLGGDGGAAPLPAQARRKPAAAGGGSGSSPALLPPLDALMLPPVAMMSPAGVAAARLLSSAKRGRPPPESSPEGDEAPLGALQRPPEGGAPAAAADVAEAVRATLLPLVGACGLWLSGERARTACASAPVAGTGVGGGAEFISQRVLEETRLAGAGWQGLYDALQRSLAPQRAWASQVAASAAASSAAPASRGAAASGAAHRRAPPRRPGATDGGAPAWSVLLGGELPMEGIVRQTLTLVGASAAFARRRDADARTHGGSDVETAWLDEIAQAHAAMLQLCTRVQALLSSLKLNTMAEFLEGATALLELMLAAARGCSDAWAARAQWLAAMLADREKRKLQHEADAVAAAAASRPLLLLAFGGATYKPLQFVAAGGEQPAAGAISSS